ncbi:hypothetical protein CTRI78_v011087 [Colletotrichum trifolii]|uniref:Uncharacterized protein n=1 Tax=Colletotrichum trifolii TaxID=5466 RepID=A0A4R8QFD7_COLTR|nr:hypothetical protein CTRI78_v011087 [Colletotrichum trifolii]
MFHAIYWFGSKSGSILIILLFFNIFPIHASPVTTSVAKLSPDQLLTKRVKVPVPPFPDDYDGRIDKGKWLKGLFALDDAQAQEYNGGVSIVSPFKDPDEMFDWGWTRHLARWPFDELREWPQFTKDLDELFADPAFPLDQSKGVAYHIVHDRRFRYPDLRFGFPTTAHYTNVVNPPAGAFIFYSNFSPHYAKSVYSKGDIPDLDTLSDFAFFQWQLGCEASGVEMTNLKVIFRAHITHERTLNIIVQALRRRGYQGIPGWDERVTFPMDSDEGLAILGTSHGASTAWMLIQHKSKLGLKTIGEVVVWESGGGFPLDQKLKDAKLNLRFTILDA